MTGKNEKNKKEPAIEPDPAPAPSQFKCRCSPYRPEHNDVSACEHEDRLVMHRWFIPKVMCGSKTIDIYVGADHGRAGETVFTVHRDVITLHSAYARDLLLDPEKKDLDLPKIKPKIFGEFVCWMYFGTFLKDKELYDDYSEEQHWVLGHFLKAPAYQNFCMSSIIEDYRIEESVHWMTGPSLKSMYKVTTKDMKLRKLVNDLVNCLEPFNDKRWTRTPKDWEKLDELQNSNSDFAADVGAKRDDKWGNDNHPLYPWSEGLREAYFEEEIPLRQAWEQQVKARNLSDIKKTKKLGEVQSIIERKFFFPTKGERVQGSEQENQ